jgi:ribosomal protein S18 acetylase RimI-like enzyme
MDIAAFDRLHRPALMKDEIANNLLISIIAGAGRDGAAPVRLWSLGRPGACAAQVQGRGVALGMLSRSDCLALADQMLGCAIPSVIGAEASAAAFAAAMREGGEGFATVERETLRVLTALLERPAVPGIFRRTRGGDVDPIHAWVHDLDKNVTMSREDVAVWVARCGVFVWCVRGVPVSMCCIGRVLPNGIVVSHVYTPPDLRAQGFAGALTAAVAAQALSGGRDYVLLYCNVANSAAMRCYDKIGFSEYARSAHYHFALARAGQRYYRPQ